MDHPQEFIQDQQNQGNRLPYTNQQFGNFDDYQKNGEDFQRDYTVDNKDSSFCQNTEFPQIANQGYDFKKGEVLDNEYFKENYQHKSSYQSYQSYQSYDTFSDTAYSNHQNQNQNSPYMNQLKGLNGDNLQEHGSFLTQLKIDDFSYDNNNNQQKQLNQKQFPTQQAYGQSTFQSLSSDFEQMDNNNLQNEYQQQYQPYPIQNQYYEQPQYDENNSSNQYLNNNQYQYQQQPQQQISDYNNNFYIDNNNKQLQQGKQIYKSKSLQVEPNKITLQRQNRTYYFGQNSLSSSNSPLEQIEIPQYQEDAYLMNNNINNTKDSDDKMFGYQEYESMRNVLKVPKNQNDAKKYLNKLSDMFFPKGSVDSNIFREKNLQILSRKKTTENKEETQRFRNMKKLIMNGILKYFQPEILSRCSQIPQKIQENIVEIANQIRQTGKCTSDKNKKMDLFSQPHFNLIFLSLNKESCACMSKNKTNINLHNQIFKFDISKYDNSIETQKKVEYINVLKNFMYLVAKQFLEKESDNEQSVVTEYKQIVLNSLEKMIVGHFINKFSSFKQLQQKSSDSDIYVE
ncbi:hypothetical protein PPERSA_06475 [Pseudocohnilembus persalinus]|uniref:Uncharacterized protein n=1 Tax=Pseudocohnilembus persalinus TaxID=266149 RepID=A0A0V0QRE8_PSEPJ|nr:hypothetical protein PPERSA_06475 [Pseudocohnilembus persalinus]|eukprot:KRX04841.1 hypothetical protein PPERSA_06475 [Pseudocohnilembus persalinus]